MVDFISLLLLETAMPILIKTIIHHPNKKKKPWAEFVFDGYLMLRLQDSVAEIFNREHPQLKVVDIAG